MTHRVCHIVCPIVGTTSYVPHRILHRTSNYDAIRSCNLSYISSKGVKTMLRKLLFPLDRTACQHQGLQHHLIWETNKHLLLKEGCFQKNRQLIHLRSLQNHILLFHGMKMTSKSHQQADKVLNQKNTAVQGIKKRSNQAKRSVPSQKQNLQRTSPQRKKRKVSELHIILLTYPC